MFQRIEAARRPPLWVSKYRSVEYRAMHASTLPNDAATPDHLATATERFSRITVIFTWPG